MLRQLLPQSQLLLSNPKLQFFFELKIFVYSIGLNLWIVWLTSILLLDSIIIRLLLPSNWVVLFSGFILNGISFFF